MNVLPQCVRKGFLGICENDHKLLGHSSLVTPNFWPLPSQKNPVKHREGKASALLHSSALKKSCHLPNKNVVSGLHQRPPLDPRKEKKQSMSRICMSKNSVDNCIWCLIELCLWFPSCPNGSLAWLPFHHYMHCSSKRILKKERPLRTWERKWERVPYLNSNVDLQTRMTNDKEKGSKTRPLTLNQQ